MGAIRNLMCRQKPPENGLADLGRVDLHDLHQTQRDCFCKALFQRLMRAFNLDLTKQRWSQERVSQFTGFDRIQALKDADLKISPSRM